MTVKHSLLTGSALHEPKGVASSTINKVYVADGAGSGTWKKPLLEDSADTSVAASGDVFQADGAGSGTWKSNPGTVYGEMYIDGNVTATTISASSTYYQVVAGWTEGDADGITFSTNEFTCVTAGDYKVSCTVSFTGATNDIWAFDIGIDTGGGYAAHGHGAIRRKTSNADVGALAVQAIVTLAVGDTVGLLVLNETDTDNPTITDANFIIELKHET